MKDDEQEFALVQTWPATFSVDEIDISELERLSTDGTRLCAALKSLSQYSPYLARLAAVHGELMDELITGDIKKNIDQIIRNVRDIPAGLLLEDIKSTLRHAKQKIHLVLALIDLAGIAGVDEICDALSDFADACVAIAMRASSEILVERKRLDPKKIKASGLSGFFVIAMGKLGGRELNYSSDIDLNFYFDPDRFPSPTTYSAKESATRLVKLIVEILEERTVDGYVFRVDLRLRPHPSATLPAISIASALDYYENQGQNWERAAMIKARFCAGDEKTAQEFLDSILSFVWRWNLDFETQSDILAILGQIQRSGNRDKLKSKGAHVKLGRGGIREIEFFLQIQQLLFGGRNSELRGNETITMLEKLVEFGICEARISQNLTSHYYFWRALEHRLQMRFDDQTHVIPENDEDREKIAHMMGFDDVKMFDEVVEKRRTAAHKMIATHFASETSLDAKYGNLVFTGVDPDPDTMRSLKEMGFSDPEVIFQIISNWHRGEAPLAKTERGRQVLTLLIPKLLEDCEHTGRPDDAFGRFRVLIEKVEIEPLRFGALLLSQESNRKDLLSVLSAAPRLSDIILSRPYVADVMFDQHSDRPLRDVNMQGRAQILSQAPAFFDEGGEQNFDDLRRFRREQGFHVGAQLVLGRVSALDAAKHFSDIAETSVQYGLKLVEQQMFPQHGMPFDYCLMGYGKLGGKELMAASDLDIVMVYDDPNGKNSKLAEQFTNRFVNLMAQPSSSGTVFEIDMQLRPYGSHSARATKFQSFGTYYQDHADCWEYMALTRARCIVGEDKQANKIKTLIHECLTESFNDRDFNVRQEIKQMRNKMRESRAAISKWDLKLASGGLVDIEFIAQTMQLLSSCYHPNTVRALRMLADNNVISKKHWKMLDEAYIFQFQLSQYIRLAMGNRFKLSETPPILLSLLLKMSEVQSTEKLKKKLKRHQDNVSRLFENYIG